MRPWRHALMAALPLLVIFIAVAVLNPKGDYWGTVEPPKAQCEAYDPVRLRTMSTLTAEVYDQRRLDRMVREPQNAITNLGYAMVGIAIILASYQPASRGLGVSAIFLGVGSGCYHVTLLPEWRMVDILGVYAVLFSLILVGATAHIDWLKRGRWRWPGVIVVLLLAVYTGVHRNDTRWLGVKWFDSLNVFVVSAVVIALLAWMVLLKAKNAKRYGWTAGVLAGAALISFAGGLGDRFGGFWANPDGWVQGHAVWHTFGAVAMWAAYEVFALTGFDHSTLK